MYKVEIRKRCVFALLSTYVKRNDWVLTRKDTAFYTIIGYKEIPPGRGITSIFFMGGMLTMDTCLYTKYDCWRRLFHEFDIRFITTIKQELTVIESILDLFSLMTNR